MRSYRRECSIYLHFKLILLACTCSLIDTIHSMLTSNETWLFKWSGPNHLHATHTTRDDSCQLFTKPLNFGTVLK